jgi:hypothetical protein
MFRPAAALAALTLAAPAFAESLSDLRRVDANTDRVILYSTAETQPAGTYYFSNYEIILLQVGYAVTDKLQVSLTGIPPLFTDQPYFFDVTAKYNLQRGDVFRSAVQVAFDTVVSPKSDPSSLFGVRAGLIGQFCLVADCLTSVTLNAGTLLNNRSNAVVPVYLAGGLLVHVTDVFKLMVEPNYAVAIGNGKVDGPSGFLLNYGLRLSGKQFGFDLAFIRPIGSDSNTLIMGVPMISFTYRTI